ARAFAPRAPSAPGGGGRDVRLTMPAIAVAHAWVHGKMRGLPAIDADVAELRGALSVEAPRVSIDVTRLTLVTRGMPLDANARGEAAVNVVVPLAGSDGVGLRVAWRGAVLGIDETARLSLEGDDLDAVIDAPRVSPEALR